MYKSRGSVPRNGLGWVCHPCHLLFYKLYLYRGPRIIAVAGNLGDLWGEQHGIETRTKPNHSWVNSGRLTIGGNYSRSPIAICMLVVHRRCWSTGGDFSLFASFFVFGAPSPAFRVVGLGSGFASTTLISSGHRSANSNAVGGGTIVGKLVSMTTRSGNFSIELILMTGLSV